MNEGYEPASKVGRRIRYMARALRHFTGEAWVPGGRVPPEDPGVLPGIRRGADPRGRVEARMTIALAVLLYFGFALLVGRFCSMNSRWERAVSGIMDEPSLAAGGAAAARPAQRVERAPRASRERRRETPRSESAAHVPRSPVQVESEEEQAVEVLC